MTLFVCAHYLYQNKGQLGLYQALHPWHRNVAGHLHLYSSGTYDSAEEANAAFTEMEARGEDVSYIRVDLPAMEQVGRVHYVDGKSVPKNLTKQAAPEGLDLAKKAAAVA